MKHPWLLGRLVLFCGLIYSSRSETSCSDNSDVRAFQALKGQAVIVSISSQTGLSKSGLCDKVTSEVEVLEAIRWTLKRLNDRSFMPGINFGLISVDSCSNSSKALDSTLRVLREFEGGSCPCGMEANCKAFGILGPDWSSHAQKLSSTLGALPPVSQFVQIAYETTAQELNDSLKYPNFFRVVPTDDLQVAAITQLLVDMKSNYFAIVFQNDNYGRGAATDLKRMAEDRGLCIGEFKTVETDASIAEIHKISHMFIGRTKRIDCVVFIGSPEVANLLMMYMGGEDKREITDSMNFILTDAIELQPRYMKYDGLSNSASIDVALGALTLSPPYREISEFSVHWKAMFQNLTLLEHESAQNPLLLSLYKELKNCDLNTQQCSPLTDLELRTNFKQNVFVSYAIEATYSLAYLFRLVHSKVCSSNELCTALQAMLASEFGKHMSGLDGVDLSELDLTEYQQSAKRLRFDQNGDINYTSSSVQYEVFNYRKCQNTHCFKKVAEYQDGVLFPRDFPTKLASYTFDYTNDGWSEQTYPASQCPSDISINCDECNTKYLPDEYYYADGDYIIVGVAPIYTAPTDSSKCGDLYYTTGVSLGEGIAFAVEDIQKRRGQFSGIFPGKTLGFIIINSCNRGIVVQEKILSIMSGQSPLGEIKGKLIGFIGELGSSISLAMSNPVTELKYVQVGYGSTSSKLSDRSVHPYFMRVCTSDDKQAEAIVKVITQIGADYIQVVFQNEPYGRGGNLSIARAIVNAGNKICVARVHEVSEHENFHTVLSKLRENSYAKVVVVFLRIKVMTDALKSFNKMEPGEFLIFGSEGWGKRPLILEDNENLVGSLTASIEMAFDKNFDDYIGKLRPKLKNKNPWLLDMMEKRLDCFYPHSFNKAKYSRECDETKGYTDAPSYLQETFVPFVIRAIQALCIGVSESINKECDGKSYCDVLRNDPTIITEEMKKIKFDLFATGDQTDVFDSNGDGNVGYKIYNIQRDPSTRKSKYVDVGQWFVDGYSTFRPDKMVYPGEKDSIESTCPNQDACNLCSGKNVDCEATGTCSDATAAGMVESYVVYAFAVICAVLLLTVILLCVFVCYHHRKRKAKKKANRYIHAVCPNDGARAWNADVDDAYDLDEPVPSPTAHSRTLHITSMGTHAPIYVPEGGSGESSASDGGPIVPPRCRQQQDATDAHPPPPHNATLYVNDPERSPIHVSSVAVKKNEMR